MGTSLNKLASYFSTQQEVRILMFGLDASGKTSILYVAKLGEVVQTIPTIGFNVETVTYGKINIVAWDVGGRDKIRPLWRHYYANTSAIVFVVDSNDRERINAAHYEFYKMVNEPELQNLPILIFANKQDLKDALTVEEITEKFNLTSLNNMNRIWHIQPSIAVTKQGIDEGFKWLANTVQSMSNLQQPFIETIKDSKIMTNDFLHAWKSNKLRTLISKLM